MRWCVPKRWSAQRHGNGLIFECFKYIEIYGEETLDFLRKLANLSMVFRFMIRFVRCF